MTASKELSQKIETNENAASDLLHQCEILQQDIKSMVQVSGSPFRFLFLLDIYIYIYISYAECDFVLCSIRVLFRR